MVTVKKTFEVQLTHEEVELAIKQFVQREVDECSGFGEVEFNSFGAIVRFSNTEEEIASGS